MGAVLVTINRNECGETVYSMTDDCWQAISRNPSLLPDIIRSLGDAADFLEKWGDEKKPAPELNIIPKRRPCPFYYTVGRHVAEIGDLADDFSHNLGSALVYLWRAGKKPGADVSEDLLKATDHILREYERLNKTQKI